MKKKEEKQRNLWIGLVDADLLDNGTRHPNLALLKIAGFLRDNNVNYELIIDGDADISKYDHIFMSKVFTFTEEPDLYTKATPTAKEKFHIGGTGYYATEPDIRIFKEKREKDMNQLENDSYLCTLENKSGGVIKNGIDMARQMPDYHLYDNYIDRQVERGYKREKYKDYLNYSIGFLTRRCHRHCPFCVNKLEKGVIEYSKLEFFHDVSRPYVYFWDDNFLAADYKIWKPILQDLIDRKIIFQFRQGLDERQFAENEHGEEMAQMLSKCRYHGDFIFAFDNWRDRPIIEKSLKIWKKYNEKKSTKFYLFCGFKQRPEAKKEFYNDIWEIFQRIKLLMQYDCIGYLMRHEDYRNAPIPNIYVQIARWCNQPQFYKKMSLWEFCYRNQSYWEEHTLPPSNRPRLKSFEEFEQDITDGYYQKVKMCLPLRTICAILEMYPEHREELIEMFNYKMTNLVDASMWKYNEQ